MSDDKTPIEYRYEFELASVRQRLEEKDREISIYVKLIEALKKAIAGSVSQ